MAAKPKTVIDLLAEQPDEELVQMRDANRQEVARARTELSRLELEGRQIELALARRGRGGQRGGRGNITRDQVYEAAKGIEPPMTAAEVQQALAAQGLEATVNAVRNHLNRLVEGELLERDGQRYVVKNYTRETADADFGPAGTDDDIPF